MDFPSKDLMHLLNMIRGKHNWDNDCFDAALNVIRYIYHQFISKGEHVVGDANFNPEEAIESLLASEQAKGFGAAIWLNLGLWLITKLLDRMANK